MGGSVNVPVSVIAREFGVSRHTVYAWIRRDGFPPAAEETPLGRLYNLGEVKEWHRNHAPVMGRPRKGQ